MKIPIVKEYGSWAVLIFSCAAGVGTGLLTSPWLTERNFYLNLLMTAAGLVFLVNSKNALSAVLKRDPAKSHILWLLFFVLTGFLLLLPFLAEGIRPFQLFSLIVLSYLILLLLGKEHSLFAELNGFALLTLSAPVVNFVITGERSLILYLAVFIFFGAGVFKVRARLKKTVFYRWAMAVYCLVSIVIFSLMNIPVIALLPLIENILFVLRIRDEKLKTTGNMELIKGVVFTVLLISFWQ